MASFKNRRINKKKIFSVLTDINGLDKEKQTAFENMKHDFAAHLSDKQSDRCDKHRRATTAIRQSLQTILSQIPFNIQNLQIEDILSKGGSLQLIDNTNNEKSFSIQIPKSVLISTNDLPKVMSQKKPNDVFKEPALHKLAVMRSASNKKGSERPNTRVLTRSALKTKVKTDINSNEKVLEPMSYTNKTNGKQITATLEEEEDKVKRILSAGQLKPPRKPNPNEEIITLAFSSTGTPLIVENKCFQRVNNKSN